MTRLIILILVLTLIVASANAQTPYYVGVTDGVRTGIAARLESATSLTWTNIGNVWRVVGSVPVGGTGSGSGTFDHSALSNVAWTASGHTGAPARIAGFLEGGAAGYIVVGNNLELDGSDNLNVTGLVSVAGLAGATNSTVLVPQLAMAGVLTNHHIDATLHNTMLAGSTIISNQAFPGLLVYRFSPYSGDAISNELTVAEFAAGVVGYTNITQYPRSFGQAIALTLPEYPAGFNNSHWTAAWGAHRSQIGLDNWRATFYVWHQDNEYYLYPMLMLDAGLSNATVQGSLTITNHGWGNVSFDGVIYGNAIGLTNFNTSALGASGAVTNSGVTINGSPVTNGAAIVVSDGTTNTFAATGALTLTVTGSDVSYGLSSNDVLGIVTGASTVAVSGNLNAGTITAENGLFLMTNTTFLSESGGLRIGLTRSGPGSGYFTMAGQAAASIVFGGGVFGDAYRRFQITADGNHLWGDGTYSPDILLSLTSRSNLTFYGTVTVTNKFKIEETEIFVVSNSISTVHGTTTNLYVPKAKIVTNWYGRHGAYRVDNTGTPQATLAAPFLLWWAPNPSQFNTAIYASSIITNSSAYGLFWEMERNSLMATSQQVTLYYYNVGFVSSLFSNAAQLQWTTRDGSTAGATVTTSNASTGLALTTTNFSSVSWVITNSLTNAISTQITLLFRATGVTNYTQNWYFRGLEVISYLP